MANSVVLTGLVLNLFTRALNPTRPLVYEDNLTIIRMLGELEKWINKNLVEGLNLEVSELIGSINEYRDQLQESIDNYQNEISGELNVLDSSVTARLVENLATVTAAINEVKDNSIELQDAVLAGILDNVESLAREKADTLYVDKSVVDSGRLSETEVDATIDARIGGRINVATYPTIQDAIDAAPDGSTLHFPSSMSPVETATGFTLKSNNLTIDAMGVEFRVTQWGVPLFLAARENNGADGHTFRIGMVRYTGVRGNHLGATIRGSAPYCSGCAVWTNGDRNYFEYVRTDGMPTPIYLSSWDGVTVSDRIGVGNRIGYLEAARYNFALLFVAQRGWDFGNAYCHDDLDDSNGANPTHAIYGSASENFRSPGGTLGRWLVENNNSGAPFQFKFTDGIKADILTANSSAGIASIQNCHDLAVNAMIGYNVKPAITGSRIIELVGAQGCKRPNIGRILVDKAPADKGESLILILDEGGFIGSILVTSRNTVDVGAEIAVRGVGTFTIPAILVTALNVPARPVRIGNGTEAGKAVGWNMPNVRSVGGGTTYDPVPVEEYTQGHSNSWGDGNSYLAAAAPTRGIFRRGMKWSNAAPATGQPRGWTQVTNGAHAKADWTAATPVAIGDFLAISNGAVIRYYVAGNTGATQPAAVAVGDRGTDGTAAFEVVSLSRATVVSDGVL